MLGTTDNTLPDVTSIAALRGSPLPGVDRHSAVWTDDERAPLVGLMRPLLANAIRSGPGEQGPA